MCYQHKVTDDDVKVEPSTIPHAGNGLFAYNSTHDNEIVFKKGQRICQYNGEKITVAVLDERYGEDTAPYAIGLNKGQVRDGAIERTIGSLLNHAINKNCNVRFTNPNKNNDVFIEAIKNIKNRTELLVNYGRDYHFNEDGVTSSTNRKKYTV